MGVALWFAAEGSEVERFETDEAWLTGLDSLVLRQKFSSLSLVGPRFLGFESPAVYLYQLEIKRIGRACYACHDDQL